MASKFDEYLKTTSSADLQTIREQIEVFKGTDIKTENVEDLDKAKAESYKKDTGRDLDTNLGGYESASSQPDNSIDDGVKERAGEAIKGAKDNLAQYPTQEKGEAQNQQSQENDMER